MNENTEYLISPVISIMCDYQSTFDSYYNKYLFLICNHDSTTVKLQLCNVFKTTVVKHLLGVQYIIIMIYLYEVQKD